MLWKQDCTDCKSKQQSAESSDTGAHFALTDANLQGTAVSKNSSIFIFKELTRYICASEAFWKKTLHCRTTGKNEVEGSLWNPFAHIPAPTRTPRAIPMWFWKVPKEENLQPVGSLCQCSVIHGAPGVQREPPVCQRVFMASGPGTGHHWQSVAPTSWHPPFRYWQTLMRSPCTSCSPGWAIPLGFSLEICKIWD